MYVHSPKSSKLISSIIWNSGNFIIPRFKKPAKKRRAFCLFFSAFPKSGVTVYKPKKFQKQAKVFIFMCRICIFQKVYMFCLIFLKKA